MLKPVTKDVITELTEGIRVAYYHFGHSLTVYTGTITAVFETRYGRKVLVQPDEVKGMALQQKWICWNEVVSYVWTPAELETALTQDDLNLLERIERVGGMYFSTEYAELARVNRLVAAGLLQAVPDPTMDSNSNMTRYEVVAPEPASTEHFTAPAFMDYNLPEYTHPCPDRTQIYLELVLKATWQFTDEDRELWLFATNREMPKVTATPLTVKWGELP